jgi:hypothetical protein
MKIKLHHILFLCMTSLALVNTAMAQDAGLTDVEIIDSEKDRLDREKIIYSPGEADVRYTPRTTTPSKDTLITPNTATPAASKFKEKPAPAPKTTVSKQSKEEQDDSILSFNFLYYIIQKYKLQDIVE